MSNLKILSINCRGLGDKKKRRDVFNCLKKKKFSIYLLQDTHFTEKEKISIRSLWGYEIYLSCGTSNSRGVAVLFNDNFEFKINKEIKDDIGNLIVLEIFMRTLRMITIPDAGKQHNFSRKKII